MKRKGFLLNTTAIILIIPLLILLATYEDASSLIITSQGERVSTERMYDVVNYIQLDFQRALEISGKRALVAMVDAVVKSGMSFEGLNSEPKYWANETIKKIMLNESVSVLRIDPKITKGQTLEDWKKSIQKKLKKMGYTADIELSDATIVVAPLDSFHIVIKAKLENVTIRDLNGRIVYHGPIPQRGYVYSIINIQNLEDPLFAVASGGRYSRVVRACQYSFPEVMAKPVTSVSGSGESSNNYDHIPGKYGDDISYSRVRIEYTPDGSYLENLSYDPTLIFNNNDQGVLVFKQGTSWCGESGLNYRIPLDITPSPTPNSLTLLRLDLTQITGPLPYHTGDAASIAIYRENSSGCTWIPFWIEEWTNTSALIWIKPPKGDGTYYLYYSPDATFSPTRGTPSIFPYYSPGFTLQASDNYSMKLISNLSWEDFFVRYRLKTANKGDADAGVGLEFPVGGRCLLVVKYINASEVSPWSSQDVQIPIYLSPEDTARLNTSTIIVRDVYGREIPFWVEYWDSRGAKIWVKANLTNNTSLISDKFQLSGDYYYNAFTICPTEKRSPLENPDKVFILYDDFENVTKWAFWHNNSDVWSGLRYRLRGYISITDQYYHSGRYALMKYRNNDWGGGVRDLPQAITLNAPGGIVLEYWDYRINDNGGTWDRVGLIDDSRNGYGAALNFRYNRIGADIRTGGRGSLTSMYFNGGEGIGKWYFVQFTIFRRTTSVELSTRLYDSSGAFLAEYDRTDIFELYSHFTKLYVWGGHDYAIDDIRIRKYIPLEDLKQATLELNKFRSYEFIDDNFNHNDHGGDKLAILQNWSVNLGNTPGIWDIDTFHRYEVRVERNNGLHFIFTLDPNSAGEKTTDVFVQYNPTTNPDVTAVVDNTGNNVTFDWVIAAPLPYGVRNIVPTSVEHKGANAVAYDIQPFIDCVKDYRYFGISGGMSFFERLELSMAHHEAYKKLAAEIDRELGYLINGQPYPIGLVSFMVPSGQYDEKLATLLSTWGITEDQLIDDRESDVDYYFLDRYMATGGNLHPGYPMWGISCLSPECTEPAIPFFIDEKTAKAIFGEVASQDLLRR